MSIVAPPPGWAFEESPFHAGERAIQARLRVEAKIDREGRRVVRDYLTEQHRSFFAQLPFLLLGAVDGEGQPWATILTGRPGFMTSPDPATLAIDAAVDSADPLADALRPGVDVGTLGIELPTRRRNRLNGRLTHADEHGLALAVGQSFGNCPQYIQTREASFVDPAPEAEHGVASRATRLSADDRALIAAADTLFIATANENADAGAARGADVSHRGGKPGFVRIDDDVTLTMPDFVGNFLFNTLGNLALDPRAGLLFVDWETGTLLHLAGTAEVIWDGPEVRSFAAAERLLRFHVRSVVRRPAALPLRFSAPGFSPLLTRTGDWDGAARALEADAARDRWRPFRVAEMVDESATVRSFVLEPADGGGVAGHDAGQHLPIRLALPDAPVPVHRAYTLSRPADGRSYRISVKRAGAVSRWLHGAGIGAIVEAMAPRGAFTFDAASIRPAVFLSSGVGITPMLAMLDSLLVNDGRTRHHAPIYFIHGVRNRAEHAFADHLHGKAALHANLTLRTVYSQPGPDDVIHRDYNAAGRIGIDYVKSVLPFDDYDFYLCGPGGFMQGLYDALRALNVPDARIRFESFGPSSVRRTRPPPSHGADTGDVVGEEGIEVDFATSGKRALWHTADGSLLEFAESQGLAPSYSCRTGLCGTCATRVLAGDVRYAERPIAPRADGEALICVARPVPGPHLGDSADRQGVTLDL